MRQGHVGGRSSGVAAVWAILTAKLVVETNSEDGRGL